MPRGWAIVWLLVAAGLLTGCWDRREIEDTAYIVSMGIDRAEDEYLWTFQIVQAEHLPAGMLTAIPAEPDRLAASLITVRGATLEQAIQLLQVGVSRTVTLEQTRYIVFGAAVARKGLGPLISQLLRHNQVRRTVGVAVTPGRAVDVLTAIHPLGEVNPAKIVEGWQLVQRQMHLSPPIRMQHFYSRLLASGGDPFMPVMAVNPGTQQPPGSPLPPMAGRSLRAGEFPRTGGNPVESAGTAIFRRDRLAGMLTVDETSALLALRGEMGKVYNSVPDPREPEQMITLRFHQENKPQYRTSFSGGRPVIHIQLQLEGEVLSSPGETDYTLPENRRVLEEAAARHLQETSFASVIKQVYGTWGADPVGLGHLYRGRFPTFSDWQAFGWADRVTEAKVTVGIELMIRRFGLLLGNPEEGEE